MTQIEQTETTEIRELSLAEMDQVGGGVETIRQWLDLTLMVIQARMIGGAHPIFTGPLR